MALPPVDDVRIVSIDRRGRGVGESPGGRRYLVRAAVPGDIVRVDASAPVARNTNRALDWCLMEASPSRITPACPDSERCGGCGLIVLDEGAQRRVKLERVLRALELRGLEHPDVDWCPSPQLLGYRNRIRLKVDASGAVGFFNPRKARCCPVLRTDLLDSLSGALEILEAHRQTMPLFSHLELRGFDAFLNAGVMLYSRSTLREPTVRGVDVLLEALEGELVAATSGLRDDEPLRTQRFALSEEVFSEVPLGSFLQVNHGTNRELIEHVLEGALRRGVRSVADLYCGCGNLSLPLFAAGLGGICVDADTAAVASLRRAARAQGMDANLERATDCPVESYLAKDGGGARRRFDLVIMNPPRKGAGAVAPGISDLSRRHVVMCSCDPETLAADLVSLCRGGFEMTQITCFDMFPQTHHVEVVAWLERSARPVNR